MMNEMTVLRVFTNRIAAYLMTEIAVSWTLENWDSRRLKIILK